LPTSSPRGEDESDERKDETRWHLEEVKELEGSAIVVLFFIHFVTVKVSDTHRRAVLPALLRPNHEPPALISRPDRTLPSAAEYCLKGMEVSVLHGSKNTV